MIAAIVVPAGVRSIAMIRACLVSGRIAVFEDEGADRMRVLDLPVDRELERTAAFGLDLGFVMGSSEVRATPSAAPPQPRRANYPAGRDPMGRHSAAPQPAQQRSDQGRKPVISEQIVAGRAKILPSLSWVRRGMRMAPARVQEGRWCGFRPSAVMSRKTVSDSWARQRLEHLNET